MRSLGLNRSLCRGGLLVAAASSLALPAASQVVVLYLGLDQFDVSPVSLVRADLHVMIDGDYRIIGTLVSGSSGEEVLSVRTAAVHLSPGSYVLDASRFSFEQVNYSSGAAGRALLTAQGSLPAGDYEHCVRVEPMGSGEALDELCETVFVESFGFMDLVHPAEGDTIDELRPALTWLKAGMPSGNELHYRLILVEKLPEQDAQVAVTSQSAIVLLPNVTSETVLYPLDAKELVPGHSYAWQVQALEPSSGRLINSTLAWDFHVRLPKRPKSLKYALPGTALDGERYMAHDDMVYFRLDEPYAAERLACELFNEEGVAVLPDDVERANDDRAIANAKQVGVNQYALDLRPYHLKSGYYTLKVVTEKGDARYLRIRTER